MDCLLPNIELNQKAQEFTKCVSFKSSLLGPGWETGKIKTKNQNRIWYSSPTRKIPFLLHKDAIEFSELMRKCNGDEYMAWEEYTRIHKERNESRRVIGTLHFDLGRDNICASVSFGNSIKCASDYLKSSGWDETKTSRRHIWISPTCKIRFLYKKVALEFQELLELHGGDEEKAFDKFAQKQTNASKKVSDFVAGGQKEAKRLLRGKRIDIQHSTGKVVETKRACVTSTSCATSIVQDETRLTSSRRSNRKRSTVNYDEHDESQINDIDAVSNTQYKSSVESIKHNKRSKQTTNFGIEEIDLGLYIGGVTYEKSTASTKISDMHQTSNGPNQRDKRPKLPDQYKPSIESIKHNKRSKQISNSGRDEIDLGLYIRDVTHEKGNTSRKSSDKHEASYRSNQRDKRPKYPRSQKSKMNQTTRKGVNPNTTKHSKKIKVAKITPCTPEKQRHDETFKRAVVKRLGL